MTTDTGTRTQTEKATFGAGCFWQVEEKFRQLDGVIDTAVGYEGGHVENPTYEQVCSGTSGHVEVCQVTFDPAKISYEQLVEKYFEIHDPTQLNRQGPDIGWQYRSVIFAHGDEQAQIARRVIERTQPRFRDPIVTEIESAQPFWRAEEYHQCYLDKRSSSGLLGTLLGR
ncbi:MAG TPA: peptide-methionine (S)-S-oxide reductase MsrA [Solirubrobacterales bacterium]|jgi:peptide-methionine (S)-S-oxide reductase|nr:peptide-methionine (S)-S-oxide reductase MsrA [Solirubrobacterales bacterium]